MRSRNLKYCLSTCMTVSHENEISHEHDNTKSSKKTYIQIKSES